jgi:gliding motility-associated protein GldE
LDPEPHSLYLAFLAISKSWIWIKIGALLFLLLGSALISGAEVAFFSLTSQHLSELDQEESVKGKLINKLLAKPKKLLATILITNNTINIATVLLFAALGELWFANIEPAWLKFTVEVVLVTFLILLFGEILPKIYASRNSVKFAGFMAIPINVLFVIFSPLSNPMQAFTQFINKRFGKLKPNLSVDQLSQALELTSKGDTTSEEQKMLEGIVSFGSTDTRQVMRPRIDVFALSDELSLSEVLTEIRKQGYSRIPVFKDNIDTIIGVLHVKDLLPYLSEKEHDWVSLVREPYFVPENKKLDDLLLEFKSLKNHVAIVVDEYGGTSGLVTLEDIIEEIVGDISDEFDDEDLVYSKLDEFTYVFEGKTALRDFYRVLKLTEVELFENQKGESETIAGLVLEIAGSFPKRGDKILFDNYIFEVEALDKKRIKQIKITLPHEE